MSYFDYQVAARYIQGEHALKELKRYTFGLGKHFMVFTACGPITEMVTETIKESFGKTMEEALMPEIAKKNPRYNRQIAEAKRFDAMRVSAAELSFKDLEGREVCETAIQSLVSEMRQGAYDVVIGVGGGKALDFARSVAYYTNIKCVLIPTSASTNAAATQLCIINTEDGKEQVNCLFLADYPSLVLADTSIIVNTPAESFAAGIADQIGSYYECLYSARRLAARGEHSDLCWEIVDSSIALLKKYAKEAVESVRERKITHAFETVLSMVVHNNGIARSVSGSGFAHLLSKALVKFPQCAGNISHGMQVGYSIIPMMIAEQESKETVMEYLAFCEEIGLPMNLKMLHLDGVCRDELLAAFEAVCAKPSAEVPFTAANLMESVEKAEMLAKEYFEGKKDE